MMQRVKRMFQANMSQIKAEKSCGFVLSYMNRSPCIGVDWLEGAVDLSPDWQAPVFPWYLTL